MASSDLRWRHMFCQRALHIACVRWSRRWRWVKRCATQLVAMCSNGAVIGNHFEYLYVYKWGLYSIADLQKYNLLELDLALSCPGTRDETCPHWDRTIQLFVCCRSQSMLCGAELGRWISPFRRYLSVEHIIVSFRRYLSVEHIIVSFHPWTAK